MRRLIGGRGKQRREESVPAFRRIGMSKRGKARKRRAANVNDTAVAPTNTNRQQNHNASANISAKSNAYTHKVAAASAGKDSDRDATRVFTPQRKSPRLSKLSLSKNRRAKRDRDRNRIRLMHDKESQNPEVSEKRNNTEMSQIKSPQNEGKTTTKQYSYLVWYSGGKEKW